MAKRKSSLEQKAEAFLLLSEQRDRITDLERQLAEAKNRVKFFQDCRATSISKVDAEAYRRKNAVLQSQLAEATHWHPISEAHEDHGECVFVNIRSDGDMGIGHALDLEFAKWVRENKYTHFQPIHLSTKTAERLIAEMKGNTNGKTL